MTLPPAHRCLFCSSLVIPADQHICPKCRQLADERARQRKTNPRCFVCRQTIYDNQAWRGGPDQLIAHIACLEKETA